MASDGNLKYQLALSRLPGMNVTLARELMSRIGSEATFFTTSATALAAMMSFSGKIFSDAVRHKALDEAERELNFIQSAGIKTLYYSSADYPALLLECSDAPVMLYQLGALDLNKIESLAIVGTRHATSYGTSFVDKLVDRIATSVADKVAITSGLAYGIDISAHRAALRNGLPTIAVLAHGLSMIYPSAHRNYAAEIISTGGALLTEYPSFATVHKGNFLARNRIVAGLSTNIVVAESDVKGGALVTARLANDYGRDVHALPGRLSDRYSSGCNMLISQNLASIINDIDDTIDNMGLKRMTVESLQQELFKVLDPVEQQIIDLLTDKGEAQLSELQITIGIPVAKLISTMIDMEFRGLIMAIPGGRYRLC